jgi:hypothetical protein
MPPRRKEKAMNFDKHKFEGDIEAITDVWENGVNKDGEEQQMEVTCPVCNRVWDGYTDVTMDYFWSEGVGYARTFTYMKDNGYAFVHLCECGTPICIGASVTGEGGCYFHVEDLEIVYK